MNERPVKLKTEIEINETETYAFPLDLGAGLVPEGVQLPPETLASHVGASTRPSCSTSGPIQLPINPPRKQQGMAQVLGCLLPTWQTRKKKLLIDCWLWPGSALLNVAT